MSIKPERVSVAVSVQHAMRMRHIVKGGLPHSTQFFSIFLTNDTIIEKKKKKLSTSNVCLEFNYNFRS